MSMIEEAMVKAKEIKTRILNTIDAFRPKLLIKKPLTELGPLAGESISGEGVGTLISKLQNRIQMIRENIGVFKEEVPSVEAPSVSPQVTEIVKSKGKRTAIHY